jgi:hypothetical protein
VLHKHDLKDADRMPMWASPDPLPLWQSVCARRRSLWAWRCPPREAHQSSSFILNNGTTYALSCEAARLGSKKEFSSAEIGAALLTAAAQIKHAAGRLAP